MKIINKLILGFLILLMFSCYKDKSIPSSEYKTLDKIKIDNIKGEYILIRLLDTLKINPTITVNGKDVSKQKNKNLEYFWGYYKDFKIQNWGKSKIDTIQISKEKELKYPVNLDNGTYNLIFGVKDVKTGIVTFNKEKNTLKVGTETTEGWYILKETDGNFTDLDFYNERRETLGTNVIGKSNNGRQLKGKPVSLSFTKYNYLNTETSEIEKHKCVVPMSESDMAMIRVSDIKELDNFNRFFMEPPTSRKPNAYLWNSFAETYIINNGKAHLKSSYSRSKFSPSINAGPYKDDYFLSKHFSSPRTILSPDNDIRFYSPIMFDNKHSSFCVLDNQKLLLFKEKVAYHYRKYFPNKNLNSDIIYMDYYNDMQTEAHIGIALLKKRTGLDTLLLTHLDLSTSIRPSNYSSRFEEEKEFYLSNPIYKIDTITTTDEFTTADFYSIHKYSPNFFYYAKDNKILVYDIESKEKEDIKILGAGEKITYINGKMNDDGEELLIVASHINGNYKVYIFNLEDGKLQEGNNNQIIIEGKGKVKQVLFIDINSTEMWM